MPRQLRIQYEGAIYHVLNRGDRREPIYLDDSDRKRFLDALGEVCSKTGWQVHAYCLMGNHFHLVVETPQANLVAGMKWLLGSYTNRFNRRHKLSGHLFGGRFKSLIVDGSQSGYLRTVCEYVHLNPARAKLLKPDQPLRDFAWSSFREYLQPSGQRVSWLRVDRLLGESGIPQDSPAGRREFERSMEARRLADTGDDWKSVRRGWFLGDDSFRKELLAQVQKQSGESHYALPRRQSAEEKADRIVLEELQRRGVSESRLEQLPKGNQDKVAIARRLRNETTISLKWIAERLKMGTWGHAANCISGRRGIMKRQPDVQSNKTPKRSIIRIENEINKERPESKLRTDPSTIEELPTHCL